MKKVWLYIFPIVLILTCYTSVAKAEENVNVVLDGETIVFDVSAQIIDGRTMVPMRTIFEKLGAVVYWDDITRTAIAQKGDCVIRITINDKMLYKNSESIALDVPAQLKTGRTLVPLRAISEAFDCDVQWDENTQTVHIYSVKNQIQTQGAKDILKKWIDDNYNDSLSNGDYIYYKGYNIEERNYVFEFSGEHISATCTFPYEGFYLNINLDDLTFNGVYSIENTKTYASGNIVKSPLSNKLELTYESFESEIYGNQEKVKDKFEAATNKLLEKFDEFLRLKNVGLSLRDFGLDYELPKDLTQQESTFSILKDFIYYMYNEKINNKPAYVYENGESKYSIQYVENYDVIRITVRSIYNDSYTYNSINLTPDKQRFRCSFSFYYPDNKTITPDFEAEYFINAKGFEDKTSVDFENISNRREYGEELFGQLANLMSLDSLSYVNFLLEKMNGTINDFGFNL